MILKLRRREEDELDLEFELDVAPTDEEIYRELVSVLKERGPMSFKELKDHFGVRAGEDRLRRVLRQAIYDGKIVEFIDGRFALPEHLCTADVIPVNKRVRPLVPPKFMEMWGDYVRMFGSIKRATHALAKNPIHRSRFCD